MDTLGDFGDLALLSALYTKKNILDIGQGGTVTFSQGPRSSSYVHAPITESSTVLSGGVSRWTSDNIELHKKAIAA